MLPLLLAAWTALAAPDPVDAITARVHPALRAPADRTERVRVVLEGTDAKALAAAAAAVPGVRVEIVVDDEVQLTVPAGRVRALATLDGVRRVRQPLAAIEHEVTSEGVPFLLVQDWHALGLTGEGVKVAVLDTGFTDYATRIAEGELPATVGFTCLRANPTTCDSSTHGTAVAEIVHDMAPDAQIHLFGASLTSEWKAAAEAIAAGDFDIVTSSIGFGNFEPIDGASSYATTVDDAVGTSDLLWFQAAGNLNPAVWTGIVTDADTDGFLEMAGQEEIPILLTGTDVLTDIRWDDSWGGADDDIDAVLVARDSGGADVVFSQAAACPAGYRGDMPQTGGSQHTPFERLDCTLPGNTATAAIKLHVEAGTGAGHRVWLMNYADLDAAWQTNERSVALPSDARKVIAVGAIGISDRVVRHYSGRGPTDDGRIKPDLVGPSTGATVTRPAFNGTSATTPHLAGLAALIVQDVRDSGGTVDRDQILAWMIAQSDDLGPAGKDNAYGWGLPQADEPWSESGDTGDTGTDTGDTGMDTDSGDTDTDTDSGDTDTDSGDTGDLPDLDGCQCATGGPLPAWLPLLAVFAGIRRRRASRVATAGAGFVVALTVVLAGCVVDDPFTAATPARRAVVEALSVRHSVDCAAAARVADDAVADLVWVAENWSDPGWVAVRAAECLPVVADAATAAPITARWSSDPALVGLADAATRGRPR